MLRPKFAVIRRDHVSRGYDVVSLHWLRWRADRKARRLTKGYARAHAIRSAWFVSPDSPRFTWDVKP